MDWSSRPSTPTTSVIYRATSRSTSNTSYRLSTAEDRGSTFLDHLAPPSDSEHGCPLGGWEAARSRASVLDFSFAAAGVSEAGLSPLVPPSPVTEDITEHDGETGHDLDSLFVASSASAATFDSAPSSPYPASTISTVSSPLAPTFGHGNTYTPDEVSDGSNDWAPWLPSSARATSLVSSSLVSSTLTSYSGIDARRRRSAILAANQFYLSSTFPRGMGSLHRRLGSGGMTLGSASVASSFGAWQSSVQSSVGTRSNSAWSGMATEGLSFSRPSRPWTATTTAIRGASNSSTASSRTVRPRTSSKTSPKKVGGTSPVRGCTAVCGLEPFDSPPKRSRLLSLFKRKESMPVEEGREWRAELLTQAVAQSLLGPQSEGNSQPSTRRRRGEKVEHGQQMVDEAPPLLLEPDYPAENVSNGVEQQQIGEQDEEEMPETPKAATTLFIAIPQREFIFDDSPPVSPSMRWIWQFPEVSEALLDTLGQ